MQLSEVASRFNDCKEDRLTDDMFNKDEVVEILDELRSHVIECMRTDLQRTVSMSVLAVRQLFEEAETHGIELEVDTALIEDKSLIEEVESLALDGPSKALRSKTRRLKAMGREQAELAEQVETLQKEATRRDRELTLLKERAAQLRSGAGSGGGGGAATGEGKAGEECGADGDFSNGGQFKGSKSFQQMRKLMAAKTNEIKQLRARLQVYEPDIVAGDTEHAASRTHK